ncbi:MAG: hypothetical protein BWX72_01422 [Firmicutes bacterium ADurb.Bin080]|nr:MAG: hypothetical protein BWX72_01422 [Firmicutes bacterium ADurb.Bin080]
MASSPNKNILLIVEGEKYEVEIFTVMGDCFLDKNTHLVFYTYKTNIYDLYDRIKRYEEYTSTIAILKEINNGNDKSCMEWNENTFAEIFLIFDFDSQDHRYASGKLEKLIDLFNDETEFGKLYINYPMMESFKDHSKDFNLDDYIGRQINTLSFKGEEYKKRVRQNGYKKDIQTYTKRHFYKLCYLNVAKENYIINGNKGYPSLDKYKEQINQREILRCQTQIMKSNKVIYVLNTSMNFILDYYGEKIYKKIQKGALE